MITPQQREHWKQTEAIYGIDTFIAQEITSILSHALIGYDISKEDWNLGVDQVIDFTTEIARQRDTAVAAIKQGIENLKDKPIEMIGEDKE